MSSYWQFFSFYVSAFNVDSGCFLYIAASYPALFLLQEDSKKYEGIF